MSEDEVVFKIVAIPGQDFCFWAEVEEDNGGLYIQIDEDKKYLSQKEIDRIENGYLRMSEKE